VFCAAARTQQRQAEATGGGAAAALLRRGLRMQCTDAGRGKREGCHEIKVNQEAMRRRSSTIPLMRPPPLLNSLHTTCNL
jgi:hypothetical protein